MILIIAFTKAIYYIEEDAGGMLSHEQLHHEQVWLGPVQINRAANYANPSQRLDPIFFQAINVGNIIITNAIS